MELKVLQVMSLCMTAKEKGHDCFLSYSPHVNSIEVITYENGWEKQADADKYMKCDLITNAPGETVVDVETVTIETMIDYLEDLIKEESNG